MAKHVINIVKHSHTHTHRCILNPKLTLIPFSCYCINLVDPLNSITTLMSRMKQCRFSIFISSFLHLLWHQRIRTLKLNNQQIIKTFVSVVHIEETPKMFYYTLRIPSLHCISNDWVFILMYFLFAFIMFEVLKTFSSAKDKLSRIRCNFLT